MGNFLENVIEKLIGDGIITETELQQRIEGARKSSPVNDINSLAVVGAVQMEVLENVGQALTMLIMRVQMLENRITELEGE